jgi:hypothetical protein
MGPNLVNSTWGLSGWAQCNPLPGEYFGTAIEEREVHWPQGQVVAILCRQAHRVAVERVRGPSVGILLRNGIDPALATHWQTSTEESLNDKWESKGGSLPKRRAVPATLYPKCPE